MAGKVRVLFVGEEQFKTFSITKVCGKWSKKRNRPIWFCLKESPKTELSESDQSSTDGNEGEADESEDNVNNFASGEEEACDNLSSEESFL